MRVVSKNPISVFTKKLTIVAQYKQLFNLLYNRIIDQDIKEHSMFCYDKSHNPSKTWSIIGEYINNYLQNNLSQIICITLTCVCLCVCMRVGERDIEYRHIFVSSHHGLYSLCHFVQVAFRAEKTDTSSRQNDNR